MPGEEAPARQLDPGAEGPEGTGRGQPLCCSQDGSAGSSDRSLARPRATVQRAGLPPAGRGQARRGGVASPLGALMGEQEEGQDVLAGVSPWVSCRLRGPGAAPEL